MTKSRKRFIKSIRAADIVIATAGAWKDGASTDDFAETKDEVGNDHFSADDLADAQIAERVPGTAADLDFGRAEAVADRFELAERVFNDLRLHGRLFREGTMRVWKRGCSIGFSKAAPSALKSISINETPRRDRPAETDISLAFHCTSPIFFG